MISYKPIVYGIAADHVASTRGPSAAFVFLLACVAGGASVWSLAASGFAALGCLVVSGALFALSNDMGRNHRRRRYEIATGYRRPR